MDLTPGEKTVLAQIRVLYSAAAGRDQQIKALTMQWPPLHHEAYQKAYGGLLAKRLLVEDAGAQAFRITDAGLKAIGVAIPRPQPQRQAPRTDQPRPLPPTPSRDAGKRRGNTLSRWVAGLLRPKI